MSRHRSAMHAPDDGEKASAVGKYLWQLTKYVLPYKGRIAVGLTTNAAARFCDLLPMVFIGRVVDHITGPAPETNTLVTYGLIVLATFLGLALFQSISDYALENMAQRVRHDLRMHLYSHLQRLDVAFFENRQTGDIMSVVAQDVDNLETFFADTTTSIIRLVITFGGTYGFLFWLDWRLALLLFAPLPFAIMAVRFFALRVQPQYRRTRKAVGEVNSILENNLQGIGVIQAYTDEDRQLERVSVQSGEYRDAAIAAALERARFVPLIYTIAGVSFGVLISGGGWLTLQGFGPSLGDFTTFVLFAMRLVLPLFVFGMIINQLQRAEASAKRIQDLLQVEPKVQDSPDAEPLAETPSRVEFKNVRFAYPERKPVINGVDFTLTPGRVLGVVGPTGAGKSTLVKLMLRYYDPISGEVLINGKPLDSLTMESYRRHVGYVSQEAFLFYGTVAENIRLGSPHATLEEVQEAARIAGADEFIDELPDGYDTLVGERGVKLSGGQRQRISLARAVLRDPPLLVLDEATSAVDTKTEEIIQRNLHRFREGRMTLAVAHRLSTVRQSDEIIVVVDGIIVERGKHEELLAAEGVYAGLWAVQSGEENGKNEILSEASQN